MNDDLAPLLSTLPEPMAPSSITANVMARIEREAALQAISAALPAKHTRNLSMWITACVGILLVTGATASGWYLHGIPDVFSPRFLRGGLDAGLVGWQATLAGVVGLVLCLRALFAPLRSR
jgi:hypothetical protein